MPKYLITLLYLVLTLTSFSQKRFPRFDYITTTGDTITNETFKNKSTLVIMGHISCPAVLQLIKDLQNSAIDTVSIILLLENTKSQIQKFNSEDTSNNIWGQVRTMFKIMPLTFSVVTFCDKEKLKFLANGTVRIQNQCNYLKLKYGAINHPKIYVIDNNGFIVKKQIGWFINLNDPKATILGLFNAKTKTREKNGST